MNQHFMGGTSDRTRSLIACGGREEREGRKRVFKDTGVSQTSLWDHSSVLNTYPRNQPLKVSTTSHSSHVVDQPYSKWILRNQNNNPVMAAQAYEPRYLCNLSRRII